MVMKKSPSKIFLFRKTPLTLLIKKPHAPTNSKNLLLLQQQNQLRGLQGQPDLAPLYVSPCENSFPWEDRHLSEAPANGHDRPQARSSHGPVAIRS